MITDILLGFLQGAFDLMFGWLPGLPMISPEVMSTIDAILGYIPDIVGALAYLYTPAFFTFLVIVAIALFNFDNIYKIILWIYHKIRG